MRMMKLVADVDNIVCFRELNMKLIVCGAEMGLYKCRFGRLTLDFVLIDFQRLSTGFRPVMKRVFENKQRLDRFAAMGLLGLNRLFQIKSCGGYRVGSCFKYNLSWCVRLFDISCTSIKCNEKKLKSSKEDFGGRLIHKIEPTCITRLKSEIRVE